MSSDVIIGHDGKPRCAWAGIGDTALGRYHDEVWGTRTHDESAMFEALTLDVFEVGLSWSIVFGKRDAFREAFQGFDVAKVAAMTEQDVDRLVQDASIVRNRGRIQATVDNARAMLSASPSLVALATSYQITRKRAPRFVADLPKSTPQAEAFAKQLKAQGTASWGRRACTRSCRTSAWSTTTSAGASALPTTRPRPGALAVKYRRSSWRRSPTGGPVDTSPAEKEGPRWQSPSPSISPAEPSNNAS
jgi:DNA-3-methyladenine glycosylase I